MTTSTTKDRELTEKELNAVTGGTFKLPTNSTIPINKPVYPFPTEGTR